MDVAQKMDGNYEMKVLIGTFICSEEFHIQHSRFTSILNTKWRADVSLNMQVSILRVITRKLLLFFRFFVQNRAHIKGFHPKMEDLDCVPVLSSTRDTIIIKPLIASKTGVSFICMSFKKGKRF